MIRPHARHLLSRKIDDADCPRIQTKAQLIVFVITRELAENDQFENMKNGVPPHTSFNMSSSSTPSSNIKVASSLTKIIFSMSIVKRRAYEFVRGCSYHVLFAETYVAIRRNPNVPEVTCIRHVHNRRYFPQSSDSFHDL